MRALSAVTIALMLCACAGGGTSQTDAGTDGHLTLADLAASNQSKVAKLSVGMSKKDVISLMGNQTSKTRDGIINNPWTVETITGKDGAQYEGLYYITRKNQPFTPVRKSLATAIVFKSGRVVAWGENALDRYK